MKKTFIVVCLFISLTSAMAQGKFEIHLGISIPSGPFAEYNYNNSFFVGSGSATTGLEVGLKYLHPISPDKRLSLTASIDLIQNGMDQKFKDDFQKTMDNSLSQYGLKTSTKYPNYLNTPVLVGVNYRIPVDEKFSIYADAGLGLNFLSITDIVATATEYMGQLKGGSQSSRIEFDSSTKFAAQVGAGFLFTNRYSIGLHYNQLGSYNITGRNVASNGKTTNINSEKAVDINQLCLTFGMLF